MKRLYKDQLYNIYVTEVRDNLRQINYVYVGVHKAENAPLATEENIHALPKRFARGSLYIGSGLCRLLKRKEAERYFGFDIPNNYIRTDGALSELRRYPRYTFLRTTLLTTVLGSEATSVESDFIKQFANHYRERCLNLRDNRYCEFLDDSSLRRGFSSSFELSHPNFEAELKLVKRYPFEEIGISHMKV